MISRVYPFRNVKSFTKKGYYRVFTLEEVATIELPVVVVPVRKKIKIEERRSVESVKVQVDNVYCTSFDSRIGRIYVASTNEGVCKVSLPKESRKEFFGWLSQHFNTDSVVDNRSRNKDVIDQLTRYFNGKLAKFNIPVDLRGTPFQIRVWKELQRLEYGTTISYKQLAKRIKVPKGFQAVGRANATNPVPVIVPCHRVLGADGSLVGYSCGIKTKEFLLRLEGAIML